MAAEQASWASRRWQRGAFSRKLGRVQRPLFDHHLATVCLQVAASVKKWTSSLFAHWNAQWTVESEDGTQEAPGALLA